jgi:hypothetical protein
MNPKNPNSSAEAPESFRFHWLFHSRRPVGGGEVDEPGKNRHRSPVFLAWESRP